MIGYARFKLPFGNPTEGKPRQQLELEKILAEIVEGMDTPDCRKDHILMGRYGSHRLPNGETCALDDPHRWTGGYIGRFIQDLCQCEFVAEERCATKRWVMAAALTTCASSTKYYPVGATQTLHDLKGRVLAGDFDEVPFGSKQASESQYWVSMVRQGFARKIAGNSSTPKGEYLKLETSIYPQLFIQPRKGPLLVNNYFCVEKHLDNLKKHMPDANLEHWRDTLRPVTFNQCLFARDSVPPGQSEKKGKWKADYCLGVTSKTFKDINGWVRCDSCRDYVELIYEQYKDLSDKITAAYKYLGPFICPFCLGQEDEKIDLSLNADDDDDAYDDDESAPDSDDEYDPCEVISNEELDALGWEAEMEKKANEQHIAVVEQ